MGMEEIIAALGDKASLVDEVKGVFDSNNSNVNRIGTLEGELNGAIDRRKNLHSLVSKATGLNELSEENLLKFASNADEGLKADNETLQLTLQELQGKFDSLGNAHESEISEMILKDSLRGLGLGDRVQNDRAFSELTKLVLDGAERDGSNFSFKKDGKTLFNEQGIKPLDIEGRVLQLQNGEFSYLFKQTQGGGGGGDTKPQVQQTKLQNAIKSTIASMGKF